MDSMELQGLWHVGYVLTSLSEDGAPNGQMMNALMQVTASPPRVAVALNKANLTHDYVSRSRVLAVSVVERKVEKGKVHVNAPTFMG